MGAMMSSQGRREAFAARLPYTSDGNLQGALGCWALDEGTRILAETEPREHGHLGAHRMMNRHVPAFDPWNAHYSSQERALLAESLAAVLPVLDALESEACQ